MSAHSSQNRKTDPYKLFVRITIILAAVALVSLVVFLVCNMLIDSEYRNVVDEIYQQNIVDEQAFNMQLNAMSEEAAAAAALGDDTTEVELQSWDSMLDGVAYRIDDEGSAGLENTYNVTISNTTLCEGGLMLVNAWHPVPDFFSSDTMVSIGAASRWSIPVTNSSVEIFPDAYNALQALYDDATAAGMKDYIVREGFRTNEEQTELFTNRMDALSDKYSGTILVEQAKKTVNYPGTSEYQTGLAFRMGLYNSEDPDVAAQDFQKTEQGLYFTDNCWKHGIVFRFPSDDFPNASWEDKSYKTGISMHLNIYRYVGKPHAVAMKVLGYCLEEYIEFLMAHPHIAIYEDNVLRYEIVRINVGDLYAYELPITNLSSEYNASIDNMGAVVMAYTYSK